MTFPCLSDDGGVASETTAPAKIANAAERQTGDHDGEKLPDAADDDTAAPETAASEEQQHSQQSLCNNTTTDAETGTATIGGDGVSVTVETPSEHFQHSDRAVFVVIITTFLLTMGIVVFIVLGGGKVGLYMTSLLVVYTFVGSADIAMKVTSNQEAEQPLSTPDLHRTLVKRGVCWLAIGALLGLSTVLWFNTYEPDPTGEVWQLEAILCAAVYYTCILMSARMVFQVHRDKQANVWRLLCFLLGSQLLRDIGDCSPYRLLSAAGTV